MYACECVRWRKKRQYESKYRCRSFFLTKNHRFLSYHLWIFFCNTISIFLSYKLDTFFWQYSMLNVLDCKHYNCNVKKTNYNPFYTFIFVVMLINVNIYEKKKSIVECYSYMTRWRCSTIWLDVMLNRLFCLCPSLECM